MKRRLLPLLLLLLAGCREPGYLVEEAPVVYGNDGTSLVVGTATVIIPYLSEDQIEGGPQLTPVDDIRSDDPSIVRVEFTTHLYELDGTSTTRGVLVYAEHEGTTSLRLFNGDSDEGTLSFTVVAAGH